MSSSYANSTPLLDLSSLRGAKHAKSPSDSLERYMNIRKRVLGDNTDRSSGVSYLKSN